MKLLYLVPAAILIIGVFNLPIGYYTLLRIIVTICALIIVYDEFQMNEFSLWMISFALIAIVFNPIFPIYLHQKSIWMPIDLITAILFIVYTFSNANAKNEKTT